ncbi:hypothetical protein [Celeribacter litoreus]|uniref:hypothetical protein n=1 Tax=Celeribacter litoreus TaxID=2876714 RepID=UPI001CCC6655|nr:hypothetical protein [Celeribacter litoreus]MCA0044472.1 hypothetical protein [Celeribacter litoreus]
MSRRIVIHAGFHKTGTTTVQNTLALNAPLLLPHAEIYLQEGISLLALRKAALDFSGNRCKATKAVIVEKATEFFASLDRSDPRPILISSESLSGHFPGSSGVGKYGSAPIIISLLYQAWRDVTGSEDTFCAYYSTRREGWLASCHWQRLKASRLKLGLDEYIAKYHAAADHPKILDDIRDRIGDEVLFTATLEDMAHPIDPLLALLNLTELRAKLTFPPDANVFPGEDAREKLLSLNRSKVWGPEYEREKLAILEGRT